MDVIADKSTFIFKLYADLLTRLGPTLLYLIVLFRAGCLRSKSRL